MDNIKKTQAPKRDNLNKIGIFLFCLYVFLSYVANGILLPHALNTISLYLFLAYSVFFVVANGKMKLSNTMLWLLFFALLSLLSMIYSPEKTIFGGTFYLLIVNFVLVTFLSQYDTDTKTIQFIAGTYVASSAIMMLLLIITGHNQESSLSGRLGETLFGNANIFATIVMISILYGLFLVVYGQKRIVQNILIVASILLNYYGLFLSGGRKYVIIPLLFLYILLLLKTDKKGKKHIVKSTVIVLAIAVVVFLLIMNVPVFYEIIGVRMKSMLAFLGGDLEGADGSSKIRSQMIEMGLSKWMKRPFYGYGFDSFKYYNVMVTGHFYYSHNNFVEMLYNLGLFGFVAYYWIYAHSFVQTFKNKNKFSNSTKAFVVAMVVSMLVYEYSAINYTATSVAIMFCIAEKMLKQQE